MEKSDVLAALAAKPQPFEVAGEVVLLRPLLAGERLALMAFLRDSEKDDDPDTASRLQHKLAAAGLCDGSGASVLTEAEVADLADATKVDAIADEVARRSGLSKGKADAPTI